MMHKNCTMMLTIKEGWYTHSIWQYIFQYRTVFITFIDDFVNFIVFSFFPYSGHTFHFPCFLLNRHLTSTMIQLVPYFLSGLSHRYFVLISEYLLCYPSATPVLKICPRKWLLCFYKFKNLIDKCKQKQKSFFKVLAGFSPLNLASSVSNYSFLRQNGCTWSPLFWYSLQVLKGLFNGLKSLNLLHQQVKLYEGGFSFSLFWDTTAGKCD